MTSEIDSASVPDSGRDIGAALWLYPEHFTSLALLGDDGLLAWAKATVAWLADGEYAVPTHGAAARVFVAIARKHGQAVADYRRKKEQTRRAVNARWDKSKRTDTDVSRTNNERTTDVILTKPNQTKPNQTKLKAGGGVTRACANADTPPPDIPLPAPVADAPTLDDILRVCRNDDCANPGGKEIPAAFGRYFHAMMEGMGWQQTNGRRVTRRNFRPFLFTWWRKSTADEWADYADGGADAAPCAEAAELAERARRDAEEAARMRERLTGGKGGAA